MPYRYLVACKLGELLGVIAHPRRIQIIEELWSGERDVGSLRETLGISHSNVSQHLAVLRAHRVVFERRQGRHVYYRLGSPEIARWLLEGTRYLPETAENLDDVKNAVHRAATAWTPASHDDLDAKPHGTME